MFQVTKVRPNDKDAKMKFSECNKIVKMIAFEKAISSEDDVPMEKKLDIESMGL